MTPPALQICYSTTSTISTTVSNCADVITATSGDEEVRTSGGLSGAGGLIGTDVPGVLGIGITAPVVLGRRLNDRGAVVPGRGDGPARLGADYGLDVGRLGMPLTYRLTVVGSTGAVIGSEHPGRGSG